MIIDDDALHSEVAGTTSGDRLEVHVWRGGELLAQNLDVTDWSLGWDAGRQVQGQGTFTVADPDGSLAPWSLSDALAPGGSRLEVTWVSGTSGIRVPRGMWRIRSVDPREEWRTYSTGAVVRRVSAGGRVVVRADEETSTAVLDRLDAEVPGAGTVLAEVARLLEDICSVTVLGGVGDRALPAATLYKAEQSRMDAVEDLLDMVDATYRMGSDGLEVVPKSGGSPVWTIAGGEDGVQISMSRTLSDEGVHNAVIAKGAGAGELQLVGRAQVDGGLLEWAGPFGRVPLFWSSAETTQAGVDADARAQLTARQDAGEVDLSVTCLTHPGLQVHDVVTLVAPTPGEVDEDWGAPLAGRVSSMTMRAAASDSGSTPSKTMSLTVAVRVADLESVAARVRGHRG